jgi:hypothetical protein
MSYDMQIIPAITGKIVFGVPEQLCNGINKLMQRVIIILMAEDGELIHYTGGRAITRSLTEEVLTRETARVAGTLQRNTPSNTPDSEILGELVLAQLVNEGSSVLIDISVKAANSDINSLIFNL